MGSDPTHPGPDRPAAAGKSYEEKLEYRRIRQEALDAIVKAAMSRVLAQIAGRTQPLHHNAFYGASAIHPRHLVTWYVFNSDADWEEAKHNGLTSDIDGLTRAELTSGGYPAEGVPCMYVSFVSDETVHVRPVVITGRISGSSAVV